MKKKMMPQVTVVAMRSQKPFK